MPADHPTPDELARRLGAADLLVFRRVTADRFAHLGGAGRGKGWAGIVEVRLEDEPVARAALDAGRPQRVHTGQPRRLIGPYYAASACVVPLEPDGLVVFGGGRAGQAGDAEATAAATLAAEAIQYVSPAKRLADELEVLHALGDLRRVSAATRAEAMQHVVTTAAAALSCELGLLYVPGQQLVAEAADGWALPGTSAERRATLQRLATAGRSWPWCVQDASGDPLPAPLDPAHGIRSALGVRVGDDALLVLAHTDACPRGFTSLCQELGARLAETAAAVLAAADDRERLRADIDRAYREARRDPLTGLHNRLAWDEAVAAEQVRIGRSGRTSVLVADVDGLKAVNDRHGHHAGDQLLRAAAQALRAAVRSMDTVARLGGDEFAVLAPGTGPDGVRRLAERVRRAAATPLTGEPVSLTTGWATCESGSCLADAVRDADARLVERKRQRAQRPGTGDLGAGV